MKKEKAIQKKPRHAMTMAEIYAEDFKDANWARVLFPINAATEFRKSIDRKAHTS